MGVEHTKPDKLRLRHLRLKMSPLNKSASEIMSQSTVPIINKQFNKSIENEAFKLFFHLCLAMSSEPLIKEVGDLIGSYRKLHSKAGRQRVADQLMMCTKTSDLRALQDESFEESMIDAFLSGWQSAFC